MTGSTGRCRRSRRAGAFVTRGLDFRALTWYGFPIDQNITLRD